MVSKNNINLNTNRFKTPKGYFEDITIDNIKKMKEKDLKFLKIILKQLILI